MDEGTHAYAHTRKYGNSPTRALVMYYMPIYICVYALVGGEISIRDPYIRAVSQICANESHAVSTGPLFVQ